MRRIIGYIYEDVIEPVKTRLRRRRNWKDKDGNLVPPSEMTTKYLINALCHGYDSEDPEYQDRAAYICEELGRRARRYFGPVRGTPPLHKFYERDEQ